MARRSFRFRLQRLLEIRILREKQAQAELRNRRFMLQQEQHKLAVLEQQEAELVQRMTLGPGDKLDIEDRKACAWAIELKKKEQSQQQRRIASAEQAVAAQEQVVKQAGIAVKALEKLKEKRFEEFHEEQLREQAVFLDDLSSQQFIRQEAERTALRAEEAEQRALTSTAADRAGQEDAILRGLATDDEFALIGAEDDTAADAAGGDA